MARNCEELVVSSDVLSLLTTSIPKEAAFLSAPSASGTLCAGASNATDGEAKGSHSSPIEGNCQMTMDCSILLPQLSRPFQPWSTPSRLRSIDEVLRGAVESSAPEGGLGNGSSMSMTLSKPSPESSGEEVSAVPLRLGLQGDCSVPKPPVAMPPVSSGHRPVLLGLKALGPINFEEVTSQMDATSAQGSPHAAAEDCSCCGTGSGSGSGPIQGMTFAFDPRTAFRSKTKPLPVSHSSSVATSSPGSHLLPGSQSLPGSLHRSPVLFSGTAISAKSGHQGPLFSRAHSGLWSSSYVFPGQESSKIKNPLDFGSIEACRMWECRGTTCSTGGCTSVPTALDVMKLREKMNSGLSSSKSNFEKLLQIMREHRDKSANGGFRPVLIPTGYSGEGKVQVCMNAFGCLAGFTEGTYRRAKTEALISSHDSAMRMITSNALACPREHEKQAVSLVRAYINHVLVEQHEMQPVASLGSADGRQTAINKKTWAEKMKDMADYFRAQEVAPELIPEVSTAAFKKLWNECKQLVEKKLSTHSKCETCGDIASAEISLSHKNSQEGVTARRALKILKHEHQQKHLGQRNQMDIACLRSIVHARTIWVIMVDSATERNFALPRLGTRNASKKLANFPLWGFKLIAAYAPNFGFVPFLVHNSVKAGANLMLTVLWETLLAMRDKYGFLPDELHLQLDNTSAENKNVTVIAVAAWLVSSGKVRRVRLFYLMVGHTHIIIDQIFRGVPSSRPRQ